MALQVGQVFADYTILRMLGSGGMGAVYLAAHPRLPRQDALKVLPPEFTEDEEYRPRFLREADLVCGLAHPNIVPIHDRGECDGQLWITMEYVAGTDALGLMRDYPGGLPVAEVAAIVGAAGSALDYAHHRGFLHRDVKPANILLTTPDGQPRRIFLADFGIARRIEDATGLTSTNMTVGTVAYASPEQLKGEPLDGRADQYSLACTAFHLLTGQPPYTDSNPAVVISKHVTATPPSLRTRRPDLAWLDPVFAAALAKNPRDRFVNCETFADQLDPRHAPLTPPADPTRPAALVAQPAATPRVRRSRVLIGALVAVPLLVAGGVYAGVTLTHRHHPGAAAPSAATQPAPTAHPAPAGGTGPFTGVYQVRLGPESKYDDPPQATAAPSTATYAVRSECGANGCVATASRLDGQLRLASTTVFDQVGGNWVSVALVPDACRDMPDEIWQVLTLQPGPDGGFTGEYRAAASNGCQEKRAVTFTRSTNVDANSLPDPAALPARVSSPAVALHGSYHINRKFSGRIPPQQVDESVVTDCLRTGDRCMSYFHSKTSDTPLVFSGGTWTMDIQHPDTIPGCGPVQVKTTAQYALPQPPQDPITTLTGQGHHQQTESCVLDIDYTETYTRTGD